MCVQTLARTHNTEKGRKNTKLVSRKGEFVVKKVSKVYFLYSMSDETKGDAMRMMTMFFFCLLFSNMCIPEKNGGRKKEIKFESKEERQACVQQKIADTLGNIAYIKDHAYMMFLLDFSIYKETS